MSDDGTGKLQGPKVQPKDKARPPASQPKASRPPASPRTAGRAGLEQNSGFSAAAAEAAAEQQSALEASNREFEESERDDELRKQLADAAAAPAQEAAEATAAAAAAAEANTAATAADGHRRLDLMPPMLPVVADRDRDRPPRAVRPDRVADRVVDQDALVREMTAQQK